VEVCVEGELGTLRAMLVDAAQAEAPGVIQNGN
jgi:hypothetical protein